MNLKTFTAESMPAALAKVKATFGPRAVILHTRTYKQGGILGFGARTIVEITAAAGNVNDDDRPRQRDKARSLVQRAQQMNRPAPAVTNNVEPNALATRDLIRKTYLAAQAEMNQGGQPKADVADVSMPALMRAGVVDAASITPPTPSVAASSANEQAVLNEALTGELQSMKRMLAKMVRQQREGASKARTKGRVGQMDLPDTLFDQYLGLLQQEVTEDLAEEIVQEVRANLSQQDLADDASVRQAVLESITHLLPSSAGAKEPAKVQDGRPRTVALIGPTGVGKTTTIAKLAANFKLREKKKVGLITIDTYRIAAVDQLRTYANIIGVPLHVISSPAEMVQANVACANCDVVLIDTAGRSQRDDPKLEQMREFVTAANPHEVHLVLSSTCTQTALFDVVDRFSQIRLDQIIFTKLDEAVTFGVILNVIRKVNKQLSYFTTGQEVPHEIEQGRADRVAELVMGGAV